jgi:hypothetical protein
VLEFIDIDIESRTAQIIALERVGDGLLVDDLARATLVSTLPAFIAAKRPLSKRRVVSHYEIAVRQESIEITGAAKLAESRWQLPDRVRVAAGAEDPHANGGAEITDIAPGSADAHDARSITFQ